MLFGSIAIFDIGSLFCAIATDFVWFCCGRAIAGMSVDVVIAPFTWGSLRIGIGAAGLFASQLHIAKPDPH